MGGEYDTETDINNRFSNRTFFSAVMFLAPEFVTKQQFPNAEGQGLEDLVTLRYAVASLIFALVAITFQLRSIEGRAFQKEVMLGYSIAFGVVCGTNILLQLAGAISAVPPIIGTGIIAILSIVTWHKLSKTEEVEDLD
jgi:hypothetical protein